jgi:hypothetical protein
VPLLVSLLSLMSFGCLLGGEHLQQIVDFKSTKFYILILLHSYYTGLIMFNFPTSSQRTPIQEFSSLMEEVIYRDSSSEKVIRFINTVDHALLRNDIDSNQDNVWHIVVRNNNRNFKAIKEIMDALVKINADINGVNAAGKTPLHLACELKLINEQGPYKNRIVNLVSFLLRNGTAVNIIDKTGNTPLQVACSRAKDKFTCQNEVKSIVEVLINHPSANDSINNKNFNGKTALDLAIISNQNKAVIPLKQKITEYFAQQKKTEGIQAASAKIDAPGMQPLPSVNVVVPLIQLQRPVATTAPPPIVPLIQLQRPVTTPALPPMVPLVQLQQPVATPALPPIQNQRHASSINTHNAIETTTSQFEVPFSYVISTQDKRVNDQEYEIFSDIIEDKIMTDDAWSNASVRLRLTHLIPDQENAEDDQMMDWSFKPTPYDG